MACYALGFPEIDRTHVAVVGGKGVNLAELSRVEGIRVPAGFCITTHAFRLVMSRTPSIDDQLNLLSRLKPEELTGIRAMSTEIRQAVEAMAIPCEVTAAITDQLARLGLHDAFAVRSSATAEDLPTASFAGQQDSYLNVMGQVEILQHISRCWASLFTERAVTYRVRNGFDHRKVQMAVVVQKMVHPQTSGVLLALLDVADAIRPHADVVAFLEQAENDGFLDELFNVAGGPEARNAIQGWLEMYGMRGVGEIDITRPRWSERPTMLLPIILGNVRNFEPGAGGRRFEQGREEARKQEVELLEQVRAMPDGARHAEETKSMIDRVRTFAGYREYPKYGMVSRYFIYKKALMEEADRLVRTRVLREQDDIFYLRFEEIQQVARTNQVDELLIRERKDAFRSYQALTPPRVLTSDGEVITGTYRRNDLPAGALVGQPVSSGIVEGRARVILDLSTADLKPGDILVTTFTDPSWTALFVAIAGLVTEVGGLMTHGAVIAREYGLPAVVGVEHATRLIQDGQRIRVHGTAGYVEILS